MCRRIENRLRWPQRCDALYRASLAPMDKKNILQVLDKLEETLHQQTCITARQSCEGKKLKIITPAIFAVVQYTSLNQFPICHLILMPSST